MAHNGGRSQMNFGFIQSGREYAYINHLKTAQNWFYQSDNTPPLPSLLDANGYPTSLAGTIRTVFFIPTQTSRPGNWVVRWVGEGAIDYSGAHTVISGTFSNTVNGRCVITPTQAVDANLSLRILMGIASVNAANPITKLEFLHVDDEADLDAGQVFTRHFKDILGLINPGVLRFQNMTQTYGESMCSVWAHRRPVDYVFYHGYEARSSLYGGVTTNVGDDYSLAFGGFVLADKATVTLQFNATASSYLNPCTLNVNGTGAKAIRNRSGSAFASTEAPLADKFAILVYDENLNVWMKMGGDTALGNKGGLNNGAPIEHLVRLCNEVGAHPWFCLPHFSLDPATNYVTQLATYCKSALDSGLIPKLEPSNEVWNNASDFASTKYADNKAFAHWGGSTTNRHNWIGKVLSTMGQDISAVYGDDRTKYQVICGVQGATGASASSSNPRLASTNYIAPDAPLDGSNSNNGSAASNWATHVALACYWGTAVSAGDETTMATEYATASVARKAELVNEYVENNNLASWATLFGQWKTWANGFSQELTMYEGGWQTFYNSTAEIDALRVGTKIATSLTSLTLQNYNAFLAAGGLFPSCFMLAGYHQYTLAASNPWSILDPDSYQTVDRPQWDAIVTFNTTSASRRKGVGIPGAMAR